MQFFKPTVSFLVLAVACLAGCSSTSMSGSTYTGGQLQQAGTLREGTVLQVRTVVADRSTDNSGSQYAAGALGGVVGAALGNNVSAGRGRQLTTVLGGAAGAAGAAELAKAGQRVQAWEIIVQLAGGGAIPITQEADGYPLRPGQRVYVLETAGRSRVVPAGMP